MSDDITVGDSVYIRSGRVQWVVKAFRLTPHGPVAFLRSAMFERSRVEPLGDLRLVPRHGSLA